MSVCLWKFDRAAVAGPSGVRLADFSGEIPQGNTVILGPSGAGKSTLLNLLVGFEQPTAGTVTCQISRTGGRLPVFWGPPGDALWPAHPVRAHLELVRPSGGDSAQVARLLEVFGLSDKSAALPDHLSQGERSRLNLARALASEAEVLVLDEPLVHVEPASLRRYWDIVHSERPPGSSMVFSTHQPELAMRHADHVFCLAEGKIVYSGSVEQLYQAPPSADLAWYLGPANWVPARESPTWLGTSSTADRCIRPAQVHIEAVETSDLVVESAELSGGLAETSLRHIPSGLTRRFLHGPTTPALRAGARVRVTLAALLAALCGLAAGCGGSSTGNEIEVRQIENWILPVDDIRIPAPRAVYADGDDLIVLDNVGRVLVYNDQGELQRQWWMPEYSIGRPERICRLADGRLAVADTHYFRVVFFDDEGRDLGHLGTFGKEPGQFIYPIAVAGDDEGYLYVCEYGGNDRIQKFDPEGNVVLSMGSFGTGPGEFQRPSGMICRGDRLYVVDAFNNRIQVFSTAGEFVEILGGEQGASQAALEYPYDIALGPDEALYVVEYGAGRVSKFDLSGRLLGRFGANGREDGQFSTPWGLTVDRQARVYVADTGNRRLVQLKL